jgi:hypothetical protein
MKDIIIKGKPYILKSKISSTLDILDKSTEYCVHIYEKRNINMNNTFYGWCRILADKLGFTFEDFKSYFLIQNGHYTMVDYNLDGNEEKTKIPTSSSDISKKEFSMILNHMMVFASERGIILPVTEDEKIKLNF